MSSHSHEVCDLARMALRMASRGPPGRLTFVHRVQAKQYGLPLLSIIYCAAPLGRLTASSHVIPT